MEQTLSNETEKEVVTLTKQARYMQLFLLVIAGGAIYPMLYMRQIYQTTMLEAFQITNGQLGELYSMLGLLFFLTYFPSGWLADRMKPMLLIAISLAGTGLLGLWYSTLPSYSSLLIIFGAWGCTTGLTFWGAVMKRIKILSGDNESGRFFGTYDGGRGLVEAILASIALFIFSQTAGDNDENVVSALVNVIYMYSWLCLILGAISLYATRYESKDAHKPTEKKEKNENLLSDIMFIIKQPEVWLIALIISAGYHLFWATYSFSAYLQEGDWGFTAVMAGTITTIKLWLRPVGGIGGGFVGDKFGNVKMLNFALIGSALGLLGLIFAPLSGMGAGLVVGLCVAFILFIGLLTYAIRGLYWAIIEHLDVPEAKLGLAIGIISLIGYCPDIFIPLINGYLMDAAESHQAGYQMYFGYTVAMTFVGIISCYLLQARANKKRAA
ncbi:MFS transporter [Vibrio hannami]|uniref:MFS transporter n=1 Tax=Vibrio hannami TaxID=2717094 RepID=UPI002410A6DD|nr:MFS transporter [Vibrio hannami]MDG3086203.1 MFS transporter [Vibrio hannami]